MGREGIRIMELTPQEKEYLQETEKDRKKRREKVCSKCAYISEIHKTNRGYATCDYSLKTGRRRPCTPLECVDKGVFKPRQRGKKKEGREEPAASQDPEAGGQAEGQEEAMYLASITKKAAAGEAGEQNNETKEQKHETKTKTTYEIDEDILDVIGMYIDKVYNAEGKEDKLRAADQLCGALDMMVAIITKEE